MASREISYATHAEADGIEALAKRLGADMRDTVRSLSVQPVLTPGWRELADKLSRVANISEMEKKLPKAKADGTLWEGEEHALRYLLEDGKLNLCLRALDEYVVFLCGVDAAASTLSFLEACSCARFEYGIGVMLANAWVHKEAMQTTDLPLFARVVRSIYLRALFHVPMMEVAKSAAADADVAEGGSGIAFADAKLPTRALESLALQFLLDAGKNAVGTLERKLLTELVKANVFEYAFRHVAQNHERLAVVDVQAALEGLSLLVATEEFGAAKAKALGTDECFLAAGTLKELLGKMVEASDATTRRKFRPLIDLSTELSRRVRR